MLKTGTEFLDSFARLGVFSKVQALMDDDTEAESSVIKSPTDSDVVATPTATTSQPSTSSSSLTVADESTTKSMYTRYCARPILTILNSNFQLINLKKVTITLKMQKRFYKAKPIIGMSGTFAVDVIVCTYGQIQPHWNCPTVQMDGSVLYLMENWRQCTQAAAHKMETTIQVDFVFL